MPPRTSAAALKDFLLALEARNKDDSTTFLKRTIARMACFNDKTQVSDCVRKLGDALAAIEFATSRDKLKTAILQTPNVHPDLAKVPVAGALLALLMTTFSEDPRAKADISGAFAIVYGDEAVGTTLEGDDVDVSGYADVNRAPIDEYREEFVRLLREVDGDVVDAALALEAQALG